VAILLLVFLQNLHQIANASSPLEPLPEESQILEMPECVYPNLSIESDYRSVDAECVFDLWSRIFGDSLSLDLATIRRTQDNKTLIISKCKALERGEVKTLAFNGKAFRGIYPDVFDIWFNNDLNPIAWTKIDGLHLANGELIADFGERVLLDPAGTACASRKFDGTEIVLIENISGPRVKSSHQIEGVFSEGRHLFALGYSASHVGKVNNYVIETYLIVGEGDEKHLILEQTANTQFSEKKFGFSAVSRGLHLLDFDPSTGLVALKDTYQEMLPFLQGTYLYSLQEQKVVERLPVTHHGLFIKTEK
jgi:hypothetical protein